MPCCGTTQGKNAKHKSTRARAMEHKGQPTRTKVTCWPTTNNTRESPATHLSVADGNGQRTLLNKDCKGKREEKASVRGA